MGEITSKSQTRVQVAERGLRPADLARDHGLSPQSVRNYEREGVLPASRRTASGYRVYTGVHALAMRAYLALVAGHGYAAAREILREVNRGDVDAALRVVDAGHAQLQRDRATLGAVEASVRLLTAEPPRAVPGRPLGVGELARRLGVAPATLRAWERAGILRPAREARSGRRSYGAADVRDAELAHLLRRGGYPLRHVADVVGQVRAVGGTAELAALAALLTDWRERLTARGRAMLTAAGALAAYLDAAGT